MDNHHNPSAQDFHNLTHSNNNSHSKEVSSHNSQICHLNFNNKLTNFNKIAPTSHFQANNKVVHNNRVVNNNNNQVDHKDAHKAAHKEGLSPVCKTVLEAVEVKDKVAKVSNLKGHLEDSLVETAQEVSKAKIKVDLSVFKVVKVNSSSNNNKAGPSVSSEAEASLATKVVNSVVASGPREVKDSK